MLSYKNDLSLAEQTKLDALLADVDITNKVVLLFTEEFEIVDQEMFNKMKTQIFEFEEDAGEVISDIYYCDLLKLYADCATVNIRDNTVYHVDIHLAICIYNGEFEQISLDN